MKTSKLFYVLIILSIGCINRQSVKMESPLSDLDTIGYSENATPGFWEIKPFAHNEDVSCNSSFAVDTVVGDFHIRYRWMPNDKVIVRHETYKYADNSLYIDMDYKGNKIVSSKEFRTNDFSDIIPKTEVPEYEFVKPYLMAVTDSCIIFNLGFYIPDTDVGAEAKLIIAADGTFTYEAIESGGLDGE